MPETFKRPAVLGLAAVLFFWLWQFLTVHYNYQDNWTALFRIRPGMPVPAFLQTEKLYIFPGSAGYDGQAYHLIAHDPWMRRSTAEVIGGAALRYQRIFTPALAWMLALGRDTWVDPAYFAVMLGSVFVGVNWLAQFCSRGGLHPAWGLLFMLTPATVTSVDRMTVDVTLAALTVGFALFAPTGTRWKTVAVLTCAALTRETALPMIAGYALYLCSRRRFADSACAAAAALPAIGWYIYLARHLTAPSNALSYVNWIPLAGLAERLFHPIVYRIVPIKNILGIAFDYASLGAVVIALALAARLAFQRRWNAGASAVYALAIAAVFVRDAGVWEEAYAFGRVFTPLLLLTALQSLGPRPWLAFMPMFLIDARLALDMWSQVAGIVGL